ncbi:16S rRNA (adenine(1518)-N(6)/adenine(1519)-N(6))-dimethyltransferase RsmA [Stomatohabitans albus]|uniref:16S rRNA (adenine(1518)-N(6)/adenine(1519)-N(6))- dimethyltransferase RsmA n=1 Tax=Stomatohabitans albus TaxID=3110766 RepID=UPI00300C3B2A
MDNHPNFPGPVASEATQGGLHGLLGGSDIKQLLASHGLAPTKKRGQNFVTDPNTVARIVRDAKVKPGDLIVEVGPGLGSLTLALLHAGARVIAVELDHGLADVVSELTKGAAIEVVCADATNVDWAELTRGTPAKMVANLPYNVATPIVMQALKGGHLSGYHVMVQKEVGRRWCATVGDPELGAVSMKMALFGQTNIAGTVARQAFYPVPNVDSVTVSITPYQESLTHHVVDLPHQPVIGPAGQAVHRDLLLRTCDVIDLGYAQRRKTLRNALANKQRKPAQIDHMLEAVSLPIGIRAELLSPQNWVDLANMFYRESWC